MLLVSLGLLMVDIDHFKAVNDRHGHVAGDAVLRELGEILHGCLRRSDEVVRWGGEELAVVLRLPWEDRAQVSLVADRLLTTVRDHVFHAGKAGELRCTVSIGFALHPLSDRVPTLLPWGAALELSDAALYLAKKEGRDRVVGVVAGPDLEARAAEAHVLIADGLEPATAAGVVAVVRGA